MGQRRTQANSKAQESAPPLKATAKGKDGEKCAKEGGAKSA